MHQWSLILVISLPLLKYSIRFFYVLSILPLTCSPPLCAIFVFFYEDRASVLRKQCAVLQGTLTLGDLKNLLGERLREIRQVGMLQCSSIPNFSFISLLSLMSIRAHLFQFYCHATTLKWQNSLRFTIQVDLLALAL